MSQARSARSIFLFGLLSLVQADSLGQLTVCIVEAYNLENLDANEAFGGTASDPYATVKVGDQKCSTVTLKDSSSAVWNHCCSFGTVLDTTAVNVIITDQDDLLEDDLIGVACTSVHGGSRWLDLIREGVTWVVGAVKLQVVFQLQSPSGVVPSPLIAANGYRSVNSTGGADPKASCPTDWKVTDCTCKAQASDSGECAYLQFSGNEQACSSPGANAQTVLGARCVNGAGLTLSNVASTQDSAAVAGEVATASCTEGSILTGCIASQTSASGEPYGPRYDEPARCSAVSGGTSVQATARCATMDAPSTPSTRAAVTLTHWEYVRPQIHEPSAEASTFARCPHGFQLTGCGCYGADGGCAGAVLGADGESCGAVLQRLPATTLASLVANPQSLFHMRHGVFAQAHCMWEGGAAELLVQADNWDAERAACTAIADSDAVMERQRSAWLGQLANATGQRWAGHSWWQVRSPELDGQLAAVGAALPAGQLDALIRTGQDQADALKGRLPSDLPGSGSAHGVYSDDDNPVESVRSKLDDARQDVTAQGAAWAAANLAQNPQAAAAALAFQEAASANWDMLGGLLDRGNQAGGGGTHNGNYHGAAASPWPPPPPPASPPPFERINEEAASSAVPAVLITLALVVAAGGGFLWFRKHRLEKGHSDRRRMLGAELEAQAGATFVSSPLQGFEPPIPIPAPTLGAGNRVMPTDSTAPLPSLPLNAL